MFICPLTISSLRQHSLISQLNGDKLHVFDWKQHSCTLLSLGLDHMRPHAENIRYKVYSPAAIKTFLIHKKWRRYAKVIDKYFFIVLVVFDDV